VEVGPAQAVHGLDDEAHRAVLRLARTVAVGLGELGELAGAEEVLRPRVMRMMVMMAG